MSGPGSATIAEAPVERLVRLAGPFDLRLTLWPHLRGTGDPTMRLSAREVWRTTRTPEGPATLRMTVDGSVVRAAAWGAGAGWAIEAVPELIGADDDPARASREHVESDPAERLLDRPARAQAAEPE